MSRIYAISSSFEKAILQKDCAQNFYLQKQLAKQKKHHTGADKFTYSQNKSSFVKSKKSQSFYFEKLKSKSDSPDTSFTSPTSVSARYFVIKKRKKTKVFCHTNNAFASLRTVFIFTIFLFCLKYFNKFQIHQTGHKSLLSLLSEIFFKKGKQTQLKLFELLVFSSKK
ncbi:hypothetical protein RFI_02770 [Reticulomyxa filosa]|uniref:Transmembrane protein n=1 Tax=Reticulomyxa filosa TaxID=46433 RepID=X6P8C2_RETFI|nr:hypothetical protein RFI_02770 [Reticulomyxa filosa]|eukprot:ETO34324.1 hypothetical protein RFI_02770 [Reticulomyxa filosa]